jgi:hypothetical protein
MTANGDQADVQSIRCLKGPSAAHNTQGSLFMASQHPRPATTVALTQTVAWLRGSRTRTATLSWELRT